MKTIDQEIEEKAFEWVKKDDGSLGHCPDCFKEGAKWAHEYSKQESNTRLMLREGRINELETLLVEANEALKIYISQIERPGEATLYYGRNLVVRITKELENIKEKE